MNNYLGENFDFYSDHDSYFLKEDALNCITYDLYFSPTYKYTCRAGCHVCYIKDKLKTGFKSFEEKVPNKISDTDEERWFKIFRYFSCLRTNDDITFLRLNYPHIFAWYKKHASLFEFGMTDNAILSQKNTLLKHLDFKGIADISLSDYFLEKANKDGIVIKVLKELLAKYPMTKFKIIRTDDCEIRDCTKSVIDWLKSRNLLNCVQHDFRKDDNTRFSLDGVFDYQTMYILSKNNRTYQIYREALHLYNDRFFFSIDDASDISWESFYQIDGEWDPKTFLVSILEGKLKLYHQFAEEISTDNSIAAKFKSYYNNSKKFTVNNNFTFIPNFLLPQGNKFHYELCHNGFMRTPYGLIIKNARSAVPIITYK